MAETGNPCAFLSVSKNGHKVSSQGVVAEAANVPASAFMLLLNKYNELKLSKRTLPSRVFNSNVQHLLDEFAEQVSLSLGGHVFDLSAPTAAAAPPPTPSSPIDKPRAEPADASAFQQCAIDFEPLKDMLGNYRQTLLTEKEHQSEELVQQIVTYINHHLTPTLTADERKEELQKQTLEFIQDISPQLSIKVTPIVKSFIARQFGLSLDNLLAEVHLPEMSVQEKTLLYQRMMNVFLDDASTHSFAFTNAKLLGNIAPVDIWFLTFFAFVTARRSRGDQLLMLGLVGKSSIGKSLLFESVVLVTGHQLISSSSHHSGEAGVGRFQTGNKNCVSHESFQVYVCCSQVFVEVSRH